MFPPGGTYVPTCVGDVWGDHQYHMLAVPRPTIVFPQVVRICVADVCT